MQGFPYRWSELCANQHYTIVINRPYESQMSRLASVAATVSLGAIEQAPAPFLKGTGSGQGGDGAGRIRVAHKRG